VIPIVLEIYRLGIIESIDEIIEKFDRFIGGLWDAFPNPFKMLDVFFVFMSGWLQVALNIPDQGIKRLAKDWAIAEGVHNKLIRVDDAIEGIFETLIKLFGTVTLTGENGLVERLLTSVGLFVYNLVKRIKFLKALLGVKTAEDFIKLIVKKWRDRLGLLRVVAAIAGVAGVVVKLAVIVLGISTVLHFEAISRYVLAQDSRIEKRRGSHRHRVNRRRGPDTRRVTP